MKHGKWVRGFLVALVLLGLPGLLMGGGKTEKGAARESKVEAEKPLVAVSILPQSYFVKRIGENTVSVMTLVGPGQSPHTYESTPRQMEELSRARVWIHLATEFDDRLKPKLKTLYPNLSIVDGTAGVIFRKLEEHEHEEEHAGQGVKQGQEKKAESHGPELEKDRHTWLGREAAKILANHVRDALIRVNPQEADRYRKNHQALVTEIDSIFEGLKKELAPLKGQRVYVHHPAFGYFLDEFGIIQEAVETGGKEPNPQTLAKLVERAKEDKVKVIFVQAQFPTQAAQTLAAQLKAEVLPLNPLAEDWLENIRRMGEALKRAAR